MLAPIEIHAPRSVADASALLQRYGDEAAVYAGGTELLIVITPRVIGDPTEAREILEQMRAQRPELQRGLRSHPSILKPEQTEPDGSSRRDTRRDTSMAEPPAPVPPAPGDPSER